MRSCEIICAHMGRRLGTWVASDLSPVSICWRDCIMGGIPPENAEEVELGALSLSEGLDLCVISSGSGGSEEGM
jgi:hypothetical protein